MTPEEQRVLDLEKQLATLLEWRRSSTEQIATVISVMNRIEATLSGNSQSGTSESLVAMARSNKAALEVLTVSVDSRFKELEPIKRLWWGISAIATVGGAGAVWHLISYLAQKHAQ